MGFIGDYFSRMVIRTSANACRNKYPALTFREALEESLLRTRPGWSPELLEYARPLLDEARSEEEMVNAIVEFENGVRAAQR
jgi:hypothetical protein